MSCADLMDLTDSDYTNKSFIWCGKVKLEQIKALEIEPTYIEHFDAFWKAHFNLKNLRDYLHLL